MLEIGLMLVLRPMNTIKDYRKVFIVIRDEIFQEFILIFLGTEVV